MNGDVEFTAFTVTHPELWARIGAARPAWLGMVPDDGMYFGLREAVCLVGKFPVDLFEAEARRAFDL